MKTRFIVEIEHSDEWTADELLTVLRFNLRGMIMKHTVEPADTLPVRDTMTSPLAADGRDC